MAKELLNGYVGIKFEAECMNDGLPDKCKEFISIFKKNGKRLLDYNMAPANGGNMSTRCEKGFLITSSGCNLGHIEDHEIVYIQEFLIEYKKVKYMGSCLPSSEIFLHGLLYNEKQEISSVIHAHDAIATSMNIRDIIDETEKEESYGTVELARLCLKTFGKGNEIIVLKKHGYVAIDKSLNNATEIIINMHKHLMQFNKII